MHVYNLCRICLAEDTNTNTMQPLFGKDETCSKILQRIEVCGGIVLKQDEQFPKMICAQCLDKLEVSYEFRSMCQASEHALLDTIVKSEMKQESQDYEISKVGEDNDNEIYFDMHTEYADAQEVHLEAITESIEEEVLESDMEPNVESAEEFIEYSDSESFEEELPNTAVRKSKSTLLKKRESTNTTITTNVTSTSDKSEGKPGKKSNRYTKKKEESVTTSIMCEVLESDMEPNGETAEEFIECSDSERFDEELPNAVRRKSKSPILHKSISSGHNSKLQRGRSKVNQKRVINIKTELDCGKKSSRGRKKKDKSEPASIMCEICGNIYTNRSILKMHMRRHKSEKPFECEICGKSFVAASDISRHMRVHTGEKPYVCKYCGRTFADRSTNIKHERIHTNERPFKCQTCGRSFTYSNVLKNHMLTHTGEKPFACVPCNKTFPRKDLLDQHIATITHQQTVGGRRQNTTNTTSNASSSPIPAVYKSNKCIERRRTYGRHNNNSSSGNN